MSTDKFRHLLDAINNPQHVNDVANKKERENAKAIESALNKRIEHLGRDFPNPRVRALMASVHDILHYRIAVAAVGVVSTLSCVVASNAPAPCMILIPNDWLAMLAENLEEQTGAIVFVGSQAVDYYNGKIFVGFLRDEIVSRARAYEAEYMLSLSEIVKNRKKSWTPSDYQASVLREFPQGLNTPAAMKLLYPLRSVQKPSRD